MEYFGQFSVTFSLFSSINTSIKLGIFEYLSKDFKTIPEIRKDLELKIRERNLLDFLDVLFAHNALLREGEGLSAKYKIANENFIKSNPKNLISLIGHFERIILNHQDMANILKNGVATHKQEIFEKIYENPEHAEFFLNTMGIVQDSHFDDILNGYDFTKYKSLLDIGGCLGNFVCKFKKRYSNMECMNFDLPIVQKFSYNYIKNQGFSENDIKFIPGDFFTTKIFPKADIVVLGNILHDWGNEKKELLMKIAYESLNEGGILIIVENFVSKERNVVRELSRSYNMLVNCIEGFDMTRQEVEDYAKNAGFKKTEFIMEKINRDGAICYK